MKVENLKSLAQKMTTTLSESAAESHFQQFSSQLKQVLVANQRSTPTTELKQKLFEALRTFDTLDLTYSERRLFTTLGYWQFVGQSAVEKIDQILYDENFDPAGVSTAIEALNTEFKSFASDVKSLEKSMSKIPDLDHADLRDGEDLLEITFLDGTSVDNVVDFQKWIDNWSMIIRNFSMLHGEAPESARVVFVQKSSPMIMDVAAITAVVLAIGKAAEYVLSRIEQYLRIQKQVEEIKKLKLGNKNIESDLTKEADKFAKKSADEITKKIVAEANVDVDGEVTNNLKLGINNLFVFIDNGGRVDCPTADPDEDEELHQMFLDIRQHQIAVDQIKLPAPNEPPAPEIEE